MVTTIGFDADDTLWHNERNFRLTHDRFADLLDDYADREVVEARMLETERRNLRLYGYGVKGFTLSMMETAIEVTGGAIDSRGMQQILAWGRDMLSHPIEPMPHVRELLSGLRDQFDLVLITKGDLFDQERKVAGSGLADFFSGVEIVSEKTASVYREIFARHGRGVENAVMVGNSMKSDILPVLDAGGWAVHVPYEVTWALEQADDPEDETRFFRIAGLSEFDPVLKRITQESTD